MEWLINNSHYLIPLWAFLLDCLLGDPHTKYHPVALIGRCIGYYEKRLYKIKDTPKQQLFHGFLTVVLVIFTVLIIAFLLQLIGGTLNPWIGYAVDVVLLYIAISPRSLGGAGLEIADLLRQNNIDKARQRVSYIVGRKTSDLDEGEITRATVETVAENTVDGIIAPLLFFALFGSLGAIFYRTVNTLDSMLGYKNERYLLFGRVAARLDDVANYIPARLTFLLYVLSAAILRHDWKAALHITFRDAHKHPSPNGGYAEAPVAGALHIRLGGYNTYGEITSFRAYMGDPKNPLRAYHIVKTVGLMYICTLLGIVVSMVLSKFVLSLF
ncbi:adenosylcobinamide-phosphate synthase CbiB [uncultured Veillonella sp.]|uniref:adenosylcobinamide-phosphate synthase CbiB n=1 Tax=uncultured Veillonella sp. TaxID=159268 RepID=UPI002603DF3B|nr:adenosylcobinamide-phosphate synthase CbiB [uncultured Veillonella sp.]